MTTRTPIRVLVAEDNAIARELLAAKLRSAGYETVMCNDGFEAIEAARREAPDAIVSDALMPRVNGFQLCQMIRRDAQLCAIPFILYTATYTEDEDRALAHRSGADALVVKPDESVSLLDVLRSTIDRVRNAPPRVPEAEPPTVAYFDEYAQRMAAKLSQKINELHLRNDDLLAAEQHVRTLNDQLAQSVERLEREVQERVRSEEALMLAEDVALLGSWTHDLVSGASWCSRQTGAMLGIPVRDRERFAVDMLEQRVVVGDRAALRQALRHDQPNAPTDVDMEIALEPIGDMPARVLHLRSRLFRDATGAPLRRIGTLRDITQQKRAEEKERALETRVRQAQKLEALGNLAGGIAHDFNNILTAVLSHSQMQQVDLAEASGTGRHALDSAREIEAASMRARDLVSQILTFSRRQVVERSPIEPANIVSEALRMVKTTAPAGVRFVEEVSASAARIRGNAGQLHQVVVNLVTNGVHAMRDTGGELLVRVTVLEVSAAFAESHAPLRAGPALRLDVSDTGRGMDAATAARVFEPFFTTKSASEGTGLGLAVVNGIVAEHDGAIDVRSEPGRGTTFSVYFPLLAGQASAVEPGAHLPANTPLGRGERILIVDDEPSVTRIGQRMLEHLGYRAEAVTDPTQARDLLAKRHREFDLVLTDRSMPRLTGEQLRVAIREIRPDLPCIMMTAYSDGLDERSVRAFGFDALLSKPFTMQALATVCSRALAR
jgi:CheY-like chemotaxis protein